MSLLCAAPCCPPPAHKHAPTKPKRWGAVPGQAERPAGGPEVARMVEDGIHRESAVSRFGLEGCGRRRENVEQVVPGLPRAKPRACGHPRWRLAGTRPVSRV